jgi:hypothetical protein
MKKLKTIILALTVQCGVAQTTLLTNLQGCYPLNNDNAVNGVTANNPLLNGTIFNVFGATGHTGLPNTAYQFLGNTSSRIELPDNVLLKPNRISFSGWIYIGSPNPAYIVFTKNACGTNQEAYSLGYSSGFFSIAKASGSGVCNRVILSSSVPVTIGQWYHVGFYMDNSIMEIYVNGVQNATTHTIPWGYTTGKNVILGGSQELVDAPFRGILDNLRFYDRRLLAYEFNFLYNNDKPCDFDCPIYQSDRGSQNPTSMVIREDGNTTNAKINSELGSFPFSVTSAAKEEVSAKPIDAKQKQIEEQQKQIETQKQIIEALNQRLKITGNSSSDIQKADNDMGQNEPNPFAKETRVEFNLSAKVKTANMMIYDLFGKQVASFPIEERGSSSILINANKLANGVYVYSIIADNQIIDVKRMVVAQD